MKWLCSAILLVGAFGSATAVDDVTKSFLRTRDLQPNKALTSLHDSNGIIAFGDTGKGDPDSACCATVNGKDGKPTSLTFQMLDTPRECDDDVPEGYVDGVKCQNGQVGPPYAPDTCQDDGKDKKSDCVNGMGSFGGEMIKLKEVMKGSKSNKEEEKMVPISPDGMFTIDDIDGSHIALRIYDMANDMIQYVRVHTSCSVPLLLGQIWGTFKLIGYDTDEYLPQQCKRTPVPPQGPPPSTDPPTLSPLSAPTPFVCYNTKPGGLQDDGCTDECPICVTRLEDDILLVPEGTGQGDECVVCVNDEEGSIRDSGCTNSNPICDEIAQECYICKHTDDGQVDEGCPLTKPLCDGGGSSGQGTGCFNCKNSEETGQDIGCLDGFYPHCVAPFGGFGYDCALCINNVTDGPDAGCLDERYPHCVAPFEGFGYECAFCINDDGDDADTGCDADAPICVADFMEGGSFCAPCINDKADIDDIDMGCSDETKECNSKFGKPGTSCTAPTPSPTSSPTASPTVSPTALPTALPTTSPTGSPTASPTASPTMSPTMSPTDSPTTTPTASPTIPEPCEIVDPREGRTYPLLITITTGCSPLEIIQNNSRIVLSDDIDCTNELGSNDDFIQIFGNNNTLDCENHYVNGGGVGAHGFLFQGIGNSLENCPNITGFFIGVGVGVGNKDYSLFLADVVLTYNQFGLFGEDASVTAVNSEFSENAVDDEFGGGIVMEGDASNPFQLIVDGSNITRNFSFGAFLRNMGTACFSRSDMSENDLFNFVNDGSVATGFPTVIMTNVNMCDATSGTDIVDAATTEGVTPTLTNTTCEVVRPQNGGDTIPAALYGCEPCS